MPYKTYFICNAIVRVAAFVCVTLAAMHFNNMHLLWWYVVPLLMGPSANRKGVQE